MIYTNSIKVVLIKYWQNENQAIFAALSFLLHYLSCIDPCTSGLNDCDVNAECTTVSSAPGYQCTCRRGYLGNGRTCVGKPSKCTGHQCMSLLCSRNIASTKTNCKLIKLYTISSSCSYLQS